MLGGHGLFTWGDDGEGLLRDDDRASSTRRSPGSPPRRAAAGLRRRSACRRCRAGARRAIAARLMPAIRGGSRQDERKVGHFDDAPEVLEFVNSHEPRAAGGARHLLPRPFPAHQDPPAGAAVRSRGDEPRRGRRRARRRARGLSRRLRGLLRALQAAEFARDARSQRGHLSRAGRRHDHLRQGQGDGAHRRASSTSTPSTSCAAPRGVSRYVGLPSRRPSTSNTGCSKRPSCSACRSRSRSPAASPWSPAAPAASAGATAARLLGEGACVVLADIDEAALDGDRRRASARRSARTRSRGALADVTDEDGGRRAPSRDAVVAFGGLDIVVSNAGIASAAPIEDTTLELWNQNMDILATGYFLVAREAFRLLKAQELGGSDRLRRLEERRSPPRPTPRPIARPRRRRSISPAAWRWKARRSASASTSSIPTRCCAARRSGRANGASSAPPPTRSTRTELEELYRQRSLLKRSVFPEDIAEAVYFFASDLSAKIDRQHPQRRRRQRAVSFTR